MDGSKYDFTSFLSQERTYNRAGRDVLDTSRYSDINLIYENGGGLYTGNISASQSKPTLRKHNIRRIVNCTRQLPNLFEDGEEFIYRRFEITRWGSSESPGEFFQETWDWINEGLENGENVLIHCLAGAHRAGATTVACVMKTLDLELDDALKYASEKRRAIAPFGSGLRFLKQLDKELQAIRNPPKADESATSKT